MRGQQQGQQQWSKHTVWQVQQQVSSCYAYQAQWLAALVQYQHVAAARASVPANTAAVHWQLLAYAGLVLSLGQHL
jgi:hypothetical protein